MKIWLTSDTHLYHDNIKKYYKRPVDVEEKIFDFWLKNIKSEDVLIHLGDVAWKRIGETMDLINILPGKKILVRGNHDYNPPAWFMNHGFDFCCDSFTMYHRFEGENKKTGGRTLLFTHVPVNSKPREIKYNIHGHLHSNNKPHREGETKLKSWHILFPVEDVGWMPVLLDKFLKDRIAYENI